MAELEKIAKITRTECFFTSTLFHDVMLNPLPFENLLTKKLKYRITIPAKIVDSGYEVCFFRDFARVNLIERQDKSFEKQTFDNIFVLADDTMIIMEAKAQQTFSLDQIANLVKAKDKIEESNLCPIKKVVLMGLHSSFYTPKETTASNFQALLTWDEISDIYSHNALIYKRADYIYKEK